VCKILPLLLLVIACSSEDLADLTMKERELRNIAAGTVLSEAPPSVSFCKEYIRASRDYRIGYINGTLHALQTELLFDHETVFTVQSKLNVFDKDVLGICWNHPNQSVMDVLYLAFDIDIKKFHPTQNHVVRR